MKHLICITPFEAPKHVIKIDFACGKEYHKILKNRKLPRTPLQAAGFSNGVNHPCRSKAVPGEEVAEM